MDTNEVEVVDEVEVVVEDIDYNVSSEDELPGGLDSSALDFATAILTGSWQNGTLEDRQNFVEDFKNYYIAASTLRAKLDAQIWGRWEAGTDNAKTLPSVRNPRTGNKPGRKAKVKTVAEQLLRK